eukprot:152965-Prorocentrum_minimum.AAC.1
MSLRTPPHPPSDALCDCVIVCAAGLHPAAHYPPHDCVTVSLADCVTLCAPGLHPAAHYPPQDCVTV